MLPTQFGSIHSHIFVFCCFLVGYIATFQLYNRLIGQEEQLQQAAYTRMKETTQAWSDWRSWNPGQPLSMAQQQHPPLDADVGRQLMQLRFLANTPQPLPRGLQAELDVWSLPVRLWYAGTPPNTLSTGELSALALSRTPLFALRSRLPDLSLHHLLAVDPALRQALTQHCPTGCPPLSVPSADAAAHEVDQKLLALLDSPDRGVMLASLALLLEAQDEAVPLLTARLQQSEPPGGQQLAFMGLMELLEGDEKQQLLQETLTRGTPALQILAMLELLRRPDASLLPLPSDAGQGIPAAALVRAFVTDRVLEVGKNEGKTGESRQAGPGTSP